MSKSKQPLRIAHCGRDTNALVGSPAPCAAPDECVVVRVQNVISYMKYKRVHPLPCMHSAKARLDVPMVVQKANTYQFANIKLCCQVKCVQEGQVGRHKGHIRLAC